MDYMIWQQSTDHYATFHTKSGAIATRVDICDAWRKSASGRTAVKHFVQGQSWTEQHGYDLKDHGVIVDLVSVFPARDR